MPEPTYIPPPGLRTPLHIFKEHVNQKYQLHLTTYADLHMFSTTRLNDFWMTVWEFAAVKATVHPHKAVDDDARIDQFPRFFEGARLNFSENILFRGEKRLAIICMNEENMNQPGRYSWQDLRDMVKTYSDAFKSSGLRKGDVVALIGTNCTRSVALLLATAAVGGIICSLAIDMGSKALDYRLGLLKPRFLIAECTYSYNGKRYDISDKLDASIAKFHKIEDCEVIAVSHQNLKSKCISFESFLARATGSDLSFEQVSFDTPMVVMFSSGTTGSPKGIIHSHGGLVMNGLKEYLLHNNIGPGDLHYQYTSIGWTLWNIAFGALFSGAAIILYDGSPFYPTTENFLKILFKQRITSFGGGPRYFSELQKLQIKPKKFARHIHSVLSTGAVLTPSLGHWLVEAFGPLCQISMSGGTEMCGALLHSSRSLPIFPGEMVKALGLDVAVYSPDGTPVADGQSGELVCLKPFPNMPIGLLDDADRQRYRSSYFAKFPRVWAHGDFVCVNPSTKGISVLGRSDGVLNPSGVRFGSSEIYNILSTPKFNEVIADAIVIGQQRIAAPFSDPAECVVLFVHCRPHATTNSIYLKPEIESAIRDQINQDLSRRHVPTFVFETKEVPYNVNGKKLEIQVKAVLCGGKEALARLELSPEERRQLSWYVKFFDIEKVVAGAQKRPLKL